MTNPFEKKFSRITNEKQHALYEDILKDVLPMPLIEIVDEDDRFFYHEGNVGNFRVRYVSEK